MNAHANQFAPELADEPQVQLIWPPRAGGPTDDDLKRSAAASDDPNFAFTISTEAWWDCYAIDPQHAHELFWTHTHLAQRLGHGPSEQEKKVWLSFGYHAATTDTGVLARTARGLVLRRDDGGEWLLPGATAVGGRRATVTGTRTGFDVLSDATIS